MTDQMSNETTSEGAYEPTTPLGTEMTEVPGTSEMSRVLRGLWDGQGSSREEVEAACGVTKVCRNMKDVTFDAMAEPGTDLGAAWRERLRREGKLREGSTSLGELVFETLSKH